MSDRLALSNAIEDAGIDRAKAERIASTIVDLIHDNVATKADVATCEHDGADHVEHNGTQRQAHGPFLQGHAFSRANVTASAAE